MSDKPIPFDLTVTSCDNWDIDRECMEILLETMKRICLKQLELLEMMESTYKEIKTGSEA